MGPPFTSNSPGVYYLLLKHSTENSFECFQISRITLTPRVLFFCSHKNAGTEETRVPFLESHDDVSGPESYFMFAVFAFNNFENEKMKLSVKVCEVWTALLFSTEQLPDLSRNRPLDRFTKIWRPRTAILVHLNILSTTPQELQCLEYFTPLHYDRYDLITLSNFFRRFQLPNRETLFQWKSEIFNNDQLYTGWNPTLFGHLQ